MSVYERPPLNTNAPFLRMARGVSNAWNIQRGADTLGPGSSTTKTCRTLGMLSTCRGLLNEKRMLRTPPVVVDTPSRCMSHSDGGIILVNCRLFIHTVHRTGEPQPPGQALSSASRFPIAATSFTWKRGNVPTVPWGRLRSSNK